MRGAPPYGFAVAIPWIKALTSELACGPPPLSRCEILAPINPQAFPLPAHDRVTVNPVQGLSPRGPDSGKHHPKPSVALLQSGNSIPSLQHSQLLSQSQILQGQVTAFSTSRNYENGQPSQCLDPGLECGGNDLNNQRISSRWSFGDGHPSQGLLACWHPSGHSAFGSIILHIRRLGMEWMGSPWSTWAASIQASAKVGCACTV